MEFRYYSLSNGSRINIHINISDNKTKVGNILEEIPWS